MAKVGGAVGPDAREYEYSLLHPCDGSGRVLVIYRVKGTNEAWDEFASTVAAHRAWTIVRALNGAG